MTLFELYATGDIRIEGGSPLEAADRWDHGRAVHLPGRVDKTLIARELLPFLLGGSTRSVGDAAYDATGDVGQRQDKAARKDKDFISFHYDVGNDFYGLFLDPEMVYSSASYASADQSLEDAQTRKLDLICRKLRLKPGQKLLDVGCGFGFGVRYWNWAGGEAYGADPSPYGELGHRILDGRIVPRYLSNVPELNGRNYDLVYASEVIEHVDDVTGFVRDLKAVTRPGGILALTTPNGDFIAADKPMSAVIAALSPGVHRLLFSLGALEAVLKQAGFAHVRAHASNEQLIAYASDAPLADGHGVDRPTYIRFLVETARDRSDPHLRMGLLYRAFKEQVNAGDRAGAEASCATLNALVQESFSLDLLDPAAVLVRVLGTVTLEDFRDRAPFFAPAFLYYAAMARLNWGAFLTDSAAGFAACAEAVHHCDRIAPSLFRELSALYWPAILHLGIARLCDGDHRAAAEALARFFPPKSDAPESPGPKLVSQARREMGVVELQTGNPEMAMHLFRQVIETADGNSKADAIKLYGLARQTADERIAPHLK
jgi:cyclopropane fatty-acyl-phospholipid synthase-like methyltransferase